MNISLVCLLAAAAPAAAGPRPLYSLSHPAVVVRGQSPQGDFYEDSPTPPSGLDSPYYSTPSPTDAPAGSGPTPGTTIETWPGSSDPFLNQSPAPYGDPFYTGPSLTVPGGAAGPQGPGVGPQPYQLNRWVSRFDGGFLPKERTDGGLGKFGVTEFDAAWEYATAGPAGWIFSFTQQFDARWWDGPSSPPAAPAVELPGSVYRFGWDLELATPANYTWGALVGFNPSINSDFERRLTSDAWNWDGRGAIIYSPTPTWTYLAGAAFWDRVEDRVIPYAGVIWTPDARWEYRLLFPDGRISYFVGEMYGRKVWIYVRGEYHVEAYEIEMERTRRREKVQLEDWRALLGIRHDGMGSAAFVEAGWVFGRDVDYLRGTPGFDISSGFIVRAGLRY